MRATVINLISKLPLQVRLTHKDEELVFSVGSYGRPSFSNQNKEMEFDVFEQLNGFWASLPEEDQDRIFDLYKEMSYYFTAIRSYAVLKEHLSHKASQLLDIQNYLKVLDWVQFYSDIIIPEHLQLEFVDDIDRNYTREQTYTRPQYVRLIALAVHLRSMIPVWGQFIDDTCKIVGEDMEEAYAFDLIEEADVLRHESFFKLKEYVEAAVNAHPHNPKAVLGWISSEDFPSWMLAKVVIKRLVIGDIRGTNQRANIVPYIHRYMMDQLQGDDQPGEKSIKSKRHDARGGGEEYHDKLSNMEAIKVKEEIPVGDIVGLENAVKDPYNVAQIVAPSISNELVTQCLINARVLLNHRIMTPQFTIMQWVLRAVIHPKGYAYLQKHLIVQCLGVAQAVLWHWASFDRRYQGHKYLAVLLTCHGDESSGEFYATDTDSKNQITKDLHAQLNHWYRFQLKPPTRRREDQKTVNPAVKSIEGVVSELYRMPWVITAPADIVAEVLGSSGSYRNRLPMDPNIKNYLAELCVQMASRRYEK